MVWRAAMLDKPVERFLVKSVFEFVEGHNFYSKG